MTIPCSNCVQDGEECVLHVSGRGKHKRVKVSKQEDQRTPSFDVSSGLSPYGTSHLSAGLAQESFIRHQARPGSPPSHAVLSTVSTISTISPVAPVVEEEDGGENVEAYKHIVDPPTTKGSLVPFYVGQCHSQTSDITMYPLCPFSGELTVLIYRGEPVPTLHLQRCQGQCSGFQCSLLG